MGLIHVQMTFISYYIEVMVKVFDSSEVYRGLESRSINWHLLHLR